VRSLPVLLAVAGALLGVGALTVVAWLARLLAVGRLERRLRRGRGRCATFLGAMDAGERALLQSAIRTRETLHGLLALDAEFDEQARAPAAAAWLDDARDRSGLVDRYAARLRTAPEPHARAFAAELLGWIGNARALPALLDAARAEEDVVQRIALRALDRIADPRAAAALAAALDGAEPWLVRHLAGALRRHGAAAVAPLVACLDEPTHRPARVWAARILGDIGTVEAIPPLARALADADEELRAEAAEALGRLRDDRVAPLLVDRLSADPSPAVRARIAGALAGRDDEHVADHLAPALEDPAWWVRRRAIEALEAIGPRSERLLVVALDDADPELRARAAAALERMDVPAAIEAALRRGERVRESAETLARLPGAPAYETLIELADRGDPPARAAALSALGAAARRGEHAERVAGARNAAFRALEAEDTGVRAGGVDALARMGLVECSGTALGLLGADPSPLVRERAALAVGVLRAPGGEVALLTVCHRAEPTSVRAAATLALGAFAQESLVARVAEMSDREAVREHLRRRLADDPVYRLLAAGLSRGRQAEIGALTEPAAESARRSLAEAVQNLVRPEERVRLVDGLRAWGGESELAALLEATRADPSPDVRAAALVAAGGLVGGEELPALARHALTDPSALVRQAALGLVAKLAPDRALALLFVGLDPGDVPPVLAAAARIAAAAFPVFAAAARALSPDAPQAVLVARLAHDIRHPDLPALLTWMVRDGVPGVRALVAALGRRRPDVLEPEAVELLALDPLVGVRLNAARAAVGAERWEVLDRLADDPESSVRREVALALGSGTRSRRRACALLARLAEDSDMPVRAAAYVGQLLQGSAVPLPPALTPSAAADALRATAHLPSLREAARAAQTDEERLAAALALALLQDEVALQVARSDPAPGVRHRVSGALELVALEPAAG